MKAIVTIMTVLGLAAGAAFAGCGKKVTDTGELKQYNADAKTITVAVGGEDKALTLQASTKITNKDGKEAKIEDLQGKKVKVVSEHNKIDTVAEV